MSQLTDKKASPRLSVGLLLLCCLAGCVGEGTAPWSRQREREVVAYDPCYGFRPTCWHPWPFCCGTQPAPTESPYGVVSGPQMLNPLDRPMESIPAPGGEPPRAQPSARPAAPPAALPPAPPGAAPAAPPSPQPGPVPTLPTGWRSAWRPPSEAPGDPRNLPRGWPEDVVGEY